jgi:hypothetical protein
MILKFGKSKTKGSARVFLLHHPTVGMSRQERVRERKQKEAQIHLFTRTHSLNNIINPFPRAHPS